MDQLKACVNVFEQLLKKEYIISAGHKGKEISVRIHFNDDQFHHLIGLQKLTDIPKISRDRKTFIKIKGNKLKYDNLTPSKYIQEVDERIAFFNQLPDILTSNIVIRFSSLKAFTSISAEIMMFKRDENGYIHLFFRHTGENRYVPCSFFQTSSDKYVIHQEQFKVLSLDIRDRFN